MRTNAYLKPEGSTPLERCKRSIFREYLLVAYSTGARPNELMTMTWGDVRINPQDTVENLQVMRLLKVRSENSKTGKSRTINAPVARRLERLQKAWGDWYAMRTNRFPVWRHQQDVKNIAWGQPATKRRRRSLSGLIQENWPDRQEDHSVFSTFYVTLRLRHGMNIHLLCKNIGSSILYIEKNYSHVVVEAIPTDYWGHGKDQNSGADDWWLEEGRQLLPTLPKSSLIWVMANSHRWEHPQKLFRMMTIRLLR